MAKKALILLLVLSLLLTIPLCACAGCLGGETKPADNALAYQELEVEVSRAIRPSNVDEEYWWIHAPDKPRVEAPKVSVPDNPVVGSRIPIVISTDPSYSLNLRMSYDEPSGQHQWYEQEYENLVPDANAEVVVNWFAPSDLTPVAKNHAVVCLFIDVYPPNRAHYSRDWRDMLAMTFFCSFVVETDTAP